MEIQSSVGEALFMSAQSVESGMSVRNTVLLAIALSVGGYLAGKAIGRIAEFASELLGRGFHKVAKGFARIGDTVIMPGTILTRNRLIPGAGEGIVTGGNSTVLKRRLLRANGLKKILKTPGWQAHHIIPYGLRSHRVLRKIGMNLDDATNGIILHEGTMHWSQHQNYSRAVRKALDDIPSDLSVEKTMERVYAIQANATGRLLEGNSLRSGLTASQEEWYCWLSRRLFD
jgi:hypothetical protein